MISIEKTNKTGHISVTSTSACCASRQREKESSQFEQHFPIWKLLGKLQGTEELQLTLELIGVTVKRRKDVLSFRNRDLSSMSKDNNLLYSQKSHYTNGKKSTKLNSFMGI